MTRLRLVILERDERAVLWHLGQGDLLQLTRTPAGPDSAPLSPRNRSAELARLEQVSARIESLRRSLEMPAPVPSSKTGPISLDQVEQHIHSFEEQADELIKKRLRLRQRMAELAAVDEQIAVVSGLDLPLEPPDSSDFLHFVTGSVPAENLPKLALGDHAALLPLTERAGRQFLMVMTTRRDRQDLDRALQQANFEPAPLPVVPGMTTGKLSGENLREQQQTAAELKDLDAKLQVLVERITPTWAQIETITGSERRLLEAEQNFPRTASSILITGWVPDADVSALEQRIQELTRGCCVMELTPAEKIGAEEIPVLLRQPRWLRPFGMLVTAYGLPQYRELEPTLFVALSYLLMFGMMFGDVGHGFIFACGGLAILWRCGRPQLRDVGLLLLFCGLSSMVFGVLYGSYFGLPALKNLALWHDPLEGDPLGFMSTAIGIGIVLMSLGLVLNVINHVRRGQALAGCLDKFGLAGILFYWGTLALLLKHTAIQSLGLATLAAIVFVPVPILGWTLKEPVEFLRRRRGSAPPPGENPDARPVPAAGPAGSLTGSFMESFVEVFEGLMSYLSNTISFVRLAAYAMSHSALLLAAFIMAEQIRHVPVAGSALSLLVIVLGNLVALVLEGIIAAVQALRLEYYEFFSKFYAGNGQPFQPFSLAAHGETS
ncbi:MAG TPA: V-type ATPase 116kDa subunit family protein [Candidatus Acidoferrales bacterium]|nr:V-type ATPase 116kDa subunit family protein [Candidatus Acidoferrales bacterium]